MFLFLTADVCVFNLTSLACFVDSPPHSHVCRDYNGNANIRNSFPSTVVLGSRISTSRKGDSDCVSQVLPPSLSKDTMFFQSKIVFCSLKFNLHRSQVTLQLLSCVLFTMDAVKKKKTTKQ